MMEYSRYDSPISPYSFTSLLIKRRKIILALFLTIFLGITGASFILPPVYESTAKVMVNYQGESEKANLLGLSQVDNRNRYDRIGSELLIIKMRSILEPVVNELDLAHRDLNKSAKLSGFGFPTDNAKTSETILFNKAIATLSKNITTEREKDTNVLTITYEDRDPVIASRVIDKVINEYVKQRPSLDRDERAFDFFEKQIAGIQKQISDLEQKGMIYKSNEKVLQPDQQTQILFSSAADFDKELTKVRANRISREARLNVIREQLAEGDDIAFPNTEASEKVGRMDYLNELKKTKLELELRKSELEKKYTEKHPDLIMVTKDIENTHQKIRVEIEEIIRAEETSVKALRAAETELAARMNQVVNSVADLSRQEYELGKLTIGIDDLKQVYSMLIRQREEARIAASKQEYLVQVRLLEPAIVAYHPIKPNKTLFAGLGFFLGIIISFGMGIFIEMFDHSVNTVEDVQNCLGLPILAAIPDFENNNKRFTPAMNSRMIMDQSVTWK